MVLDKVIAKTSSIYFRGFAADCPIFQVFTIPRAVNSGARTSFRKRSSIESSQDFPAIERFCTRYRRRSLVSCTRHLYCLSQLYRYTLGRCLLNSGLRLINLRLKLIAFATVVPLIIIEMMHHLYL